MELNLIDPFNPKDTMVLGYADPAKRAEAIVYYSHSANVFDLYRDPDLLLPMLTQIGCFFRVLDADTYFAVEEQIIADVALEDETAPFVVYGLGQNILHENPYIINGDKSLPDMVQSFFEHCRSKRR